MKCLICSDSHGNLDFIEDVFEIAKQEKVDLIIHCGDDYEDAEFFCEQKMPCIRVPGTWSHYYQHPMIENRRIEECEGWRYLLSHTPTTDRHDLPEDPDPQVWFENRDVNIFFHGHTHKPEIERISPTRIRVNPGHIKAENDRGFPASFAIMDCSKSTCHIRIITLKTKDIIDEETLSR